MCAGCSNVGYMPKEYLSEHVSLLLKCSRGLPKPVSRWRCPIISRAPYIFQTIGVPMGRCLAGLVSVRPQYTGGASFDVVVESVCRMNLRIGIRSATTAYAPRTRVVGIPLNNDTNDHTPSGILTQDILQAYHNSTFYVAQCYLFILA